MNRYLTEAFGTFLLTAVVGLSLAGNFPVATPILAGLTLGLFVYAAGGISGSHINPAVTIGLWSLKKISSADAAFYIIAQFAGAGAAALIINLLAVGPALTVAAAWPVFFSEALGALAFTFGIAAVAEGQVPAGASGAVIGGSLLLGLAIAASASNAVLNPAVALGIGSFSWIYLFSPIVGSLLGMNLYRWLLKN